MLAEEQPAKTVVTKQAESRSFAGARLAAAAGSARAAQDDNSLFVFVRHGSTQSFQNSAFHKTILWVTATLEPP
jgi:hypothetical protein